MQIQQFVDEGLGNAAHLVISETTGDAVLIDPLRDVDRYLDAAAAAGVRITHVLETHIHNDFTIGSRELAARDGVRIVASALAELQYDYHPVRHGDVVEVGDLQVRVLATPGHTPEHVSYLVEEHEGTTQSPVLFSGGSLLVGAVSRTDLLGPEHAEHLAYSLYRSLHEHILPLPDEVAVYPTHGAGSFCTAAPGAARSTTIGQERHGRSGTRIPSLRSPLRPRLWSACSA
jgi:hydroxyacylglutathione hydrolase